MYTKLKQLIAATLSVVHIGSGTRKRKSKENINISYQPRKIYGKIL